MKKLTGQCASVETFNKRMQVVEQNIESIKDSAEKRHESTRDYIARVKEALKFYQPIIDKDAQVITAELSSSPTDEESSSDPQK